MSLNNNAEIRCPPCARIKDMKDHIAEVSGDFSHQQKTSRIVKILGVVETMVARWGLEKQDPDPPVMTESSSVNVPLSDSNSIAHIK